MLMEVVSGMDSNDFTLEVEMPQHLLREDDEEEEETEEGTGWLPAAIVFPVMVGAAVWKGMVISLIGIAWQFIIWAYILLDFVYDSVVRLFIGSICAPCAWLFIWAFKLPTFPLVIFGWFFRIMTESMGALVSGWMLFFGGSGCYLRWGYDCWFATRFHEKSYWEIADLPVWMRRLANPDTLFVKDAEMTFSESLHEFFSIPMIGDFSTEAARIIGENRRDQLAESCPINSNTFADVKNSTNEALAFFGL